MGTPVPEPSRRNQPWRSRTASSFRERRPEMTLQKNLSLGGVSGEASPRLLRILSRFSPYYRPLPRGCSSFGGFSCFGAGFEACDGSRGAVCCGELCLGTLSLGAFSRGCVAAWGSCCGWAALGRLSLAPPEFPRDSWAVEALPFAGGVKGRNPSFDFPFAFPRFPAAVDATRASLGDIAGAWYSPPAARAGTAE